MQSLIRQRYLQGFEGADLAPRRARMVEAYVNGVEGELVDDVELCRIGGFRPGDANKARIQMHKVFESPAEKNVTCYAAEREYVSFLQAANLEKSEWSGEVIRQRLQRNVMFAHGEIPYDKLVTGSYKGSISTKVVRVAEINLPAANASLHLLGKQQGMFKDQVEHSGPDGGPIQTRKVEYVGVTDD